MDDAAGDPVVDIYARLSRAVNGETIKVEDQIAMGIEDVVARGGRVGEVFTDNSLSAWSPRVVRKNWLRLMDRLENRQSSGVWVYDLYRFSRKVMEGERLLEAAVDGLHVWSHSGEYDLTTADGRGDFRGAIAAAAKESDKTSERVKRGKFRTAREGGSHGAGRSYAMPGLVRRDTKAETGSAGSGRAVKRRRMESDDRVDAERVIAKDCIERLLAGDTVYALVKELNERGAAGERPALPVSGKTWGPTMLLKTLCRPAMAGLVVHQGAVMGESAEFDPVVERQMWERLVAKVAARKTGRPPIDRHMLTGTIRCGRCGARLHALVYASKGTYADGSPLRVYRCPGPGRAKFGSCGRNTIDAAIAEDAVVEAVTTRLQDPEHVELVAEQMRHARSRRAEITDELDSWESEADALAGKTKEWGVARVDEAMKPILHHIEQLREQLARLGADDLSGAAVHGALAKWDEVRAENDVIEQRRIIRRTFPHLALAPQTRRGDHDPGRLLWNGPTEPTEPTGSTEPTEPTDEPTGSTS